MAGEGGDFWENPFGGLFDINGDGREDLAEQFLGFQVAEGTKEETDGEDALFSDGEDTGFACADELTNRSLQNSFRTNPAKETVCSAEAKPKTGRKKQKGEEQEGQTAAAAITTPQEYCSQRTWEVAGESAAFVFGLPFCVIPCLLIWLAVSVYDDHNSVSWFVSLIVGGIGLAFLIAILQAIFQAVKESRLEWKEKKETYLASLSQEEREDFRRYKRRSTFRGIIYLITALGVLAALIILYMVS